MEIYSKEEKFEPVPKETWRCGQKEHFLEEWEIVPISPTPTKKSNLKDFADNLELKFFVYKATVYAEKLALGIFLEGNGNSVCYLDILKEEMNQSEQVKAVSFIEVETPMGTGLSQK